MNNRKVWIISGLLMVALVGLVSAPAQAWWTSPTTSSEPTVVIQDDGWVTIQGKILFNQSLNAYVVQAIVPPGVHGEYLIANPKNRVLSPYAKKGNTVTVQGHLPDDAFSLQVTSINGKAY